LRRCFVETGHAGVAFFDRGAGPDRTVVRDAGEIGLVMVLELGFLEGNDIGRASGQPVVKPLVRGGAQAVDIPGIELHARFLWVIGAAKAWSAVDAPRDASSWADRRKFSSRGRQSKPPAATFPVV